jgi:hypothetical protein
MAGHEDMAAAGERAVRAMQAARTARRSRKSRRLALSTAAGPGAGEQAAGRDAADPQPAGHETAG